MIRIIDIDGLSLDEIEHLLNKNDDWELVSFGSNSYCTRGGGWGGPAPKTVYKTFMAVKQIAEYATDFKE